MIVFFFIHCTKFADLKYSKNLIIQRNFSKFKEYDIWKIIKNWNFKIGKKKQKFGCL